MNNIFIGGGFPSIKEKINVVINEKKTRDFTTNILSLTEIFKKQSVKKNNINKKEYSNNHKAINIIYNKSHDNLSNIKYNSINNFIHDPEILNIYNKKLK